MKYTQSELDSITGTFEGSSAQFKEGLSVTKTSQTVLDGNTVAHTAINKADQNFKSYADALNKNIRDMFDLGENYAAFDRAQGEVNRSKG